MQFSLMSGWLCYARSREGYRPFMPLSALRDPGTHYVSDSVNGYLLVVSEARVF